MFNAAGLHVRKPGDSKPQPLTRQTSDATEDLRNPEYSRSIMSQKGLRDRGSTTCDPYGESGAGFEALRRQQEQAFWAQQ